MRASGWLRLSAVILSLAVAAARAPAQQTALGLFHGQTDVGQVTKRGSVTYDAVRERYTIAGSGANMWFDRDDFHFVWRRIQGNFLLLARAQFDGPGVEPHRKLGWTVRSDFATGSPPTGTTSGAIWRSSTSRRGSARSCTALPSRSRRPTGPGTARR